MNLNSNWIELLNRFDASGVRYLIVGGYALMNYTEPRYTKDIDIWIDAAPDNAPKVFRALAEFGAPLNGIHPTLFAEPEIVYQMGRPPARVDILTSLTAVDFSDCWERRVAGRFGAREVFLISIDDLITNKKALGRLQDLADVEQLEAARNPPQP